MSLEKVKDLFRKVKDLALMVLGHACSGFGAAAIYELTQQYSAGGYEIETLLIGAFLGGSIGFMRKAIDALEAITPKRTALGTNQKQSVMKPVRRYFGL